MTEICNADDYTRAKLVAVLRTHSLAAFAGCDSLCACRNLWRTNEAHRAHIVDELLPVVQTIADAAVARGRAVALLDAADAWQQGAWTNTPRNADRIAERIGAAQYVTDWLRARASGVSPS